MSVFTVMVAIAGGLLLGYLALTYGVAVLYGAGVVAAVVAILTYPWRR